MYLHEPYGNAVISSHITHSRKQHLLTSDSLYDLSTFTRKRLVILEPKTASHYYDQSLPVIDQSLLGPKFHDQSFANHDTDATAPVLVASSTSGTSDSFHIFVVGESTKTRAG